MLTPFPQFASLTRCLRTAGLRQPAAGPAVSRLPRVVVANLIIAAAFITGLVLWDLLGTLPLPLGVMGHEGSTVIVGLNGLRLPRAVAWRPPGAAGADLTRC